MKRIRIVVGVIGLIGLGVLGGAGPAAADFHAACTPDGQANVDLTLSGGEFTYSGFVECGGSSSISITSLTLTRPDGSVAAAPTASCSGCARLTAEGKDPAVQPGTYRVRMAFTVVVGSQTFRPTRTREFSWDGASSLTPRATSWPQLCSPAGSASVGFANDNSVLTDPRIAWTGTVTCKNADSVQVTSLTVTLPDRRVLEAQTLGSCTTPCSAPVLSSGSAPTAGPGIYTVRIRFNVTRGAQTFNNQTAVAGWTSLGLGPVRRN